jgi:hypothetical protein
MQLEDTLKPAVRAASAPAHSVATTMAGRRGATRHAGAQASVAVAAAFTGEAVEVAGGGSG